jgi:rubrerythrin
MNLKIYTLDDLLLTAIKAEVDSKTLYAKLSNRVENFMLKERLQFLSGEEAKHQRFFTSLYHEYNPGKEISLPSKTPVPLPQIVIDSDSTPVSKILESAMQAEKTAYDFYNGIAERFEEKPDIKKMVLYIASMEMGHFKIIEIEKENAEKFEGFNMEWPLMHVGP